MTPMIMTRVTMDGDGYLDIWIYGNDDLLIASEAPELSFNVVISKQAVVFIGTILAIVPNNYFKKNIDN